MAFDYVWPPGAAPKKDVTMTEKNKPVVHFTKGDDNICNWGKNIGDRLTTDKGKVTCPRCQGYLDDQFRLRVLDLPNIVTKEQLKYAGDVLGRNADEMKKKGARREDHYAQNQLAHWLWQIAGAAKGPSSSSAPRRRSTPRRRSQP